MLTQLNKMSSAPLRRRNSRRGVLVETSDPGSDLSKTTINMPNLDNWRDSLEDSRALMKTGLGLVLVGHMNFLLAALLHGAVLRHVSLHEQARVTEYAVANVVVIIAGLLAVIAGILAIVMSKKKKSGLWMSILLLVSLLAGLLAIASMVGFIVSLVTAIQNKGLKLFTHCSSLDTISYYSITTECPFDPTRVYGTTVALWLFLILICVVEILFSFRCCAASACILSLSPPCGRKKRRRRVGKKQVTVQLPQEMTSLSQDRPSTQEEDSEAQEYDLLKADSTLLQL
ncbi:transmembrane protein 54-like isoform X1 [Brienomyrus brachyistius]|uniref:transmembrane protein 54-like isoform X1 n=2 Tax=Brienomyrus brachyistius TaxID=42636 RepID=UPI0020B2C84D|nr:transmembrane protein 54-like isoform X1 [Brienomyrus brachyistius]